MATGCIEIGKTNRTWVIVGIDCCEEIDLEIAMLYKLSDDNMAVVAISNQLDHAKVI